MATSREEGGRYDGGLGAGGKFKKRPFRRTSQATPYDRPPTAIRNPGSGNGNGWLSKLTDPAQRLIAYSANKLFASVFRKRLAPPPAPESSEPESNQETRENFQEAASTVPPARQEGAPDGSGGIPSIQSDGGKFTELEAILKQKTFTRAEIDHLTTLLHARTADNVSETGERRSEVKPSVLPRNEDFPHTYSRENGTEIPHISTPLSISNLAKVPDEGIASPAELAKAYMGGQPSKVSTSIISLRSQPQKDNFSVPSSSLFPSKSPVMSLVPRSSGHIAGLENGFKPARSRGRSAIYNMARTPYSRANTSASFKNAGPRADALAGPSSSSSPQSGWDQSRLSVSRQVALKRRLDIDVGSVGPIRRIRQKSNLLSPRSLAVPASGSPLTIYENESGSETQNSLSLMNKPFSSSEVKDTITKPSTENGTSGTPSKSTSPVPSKSSQMASKILNQLNELVSTREKSPTKLSPSMLNGPALKSLENVDSSKLLENSRGKNKLDCLDGASLPGIQGSMSNKQDKFEENSRMKLFAPLDKSVSMVNSVGPSNLFNETVPSTNATGSLSMKCVAPFPQQKKRAFKMSAHEDYLDLDDDDNQPNVTASSLFAIKREKLNSSATGNENIAPEPTIGERPSTVSEIKPHGSPVVDQKPSSGPYDGSLNTEKEANIASREANLLTTSTQPAVLASPPASFVEKTVSSELSSGSPIFSSGEKKSFPSKGQNGSIFSFGAATDNKVQSVSETSGFKSDGGSDSRPGNSNSFASVAPAANNVAKSDESTKADNDNISKPGFLFGALATANGSAVSTTSSSGSMFKFGGAANTSNGSFASSLLFSSQPSPVIPNNNASQSSSSTNATGTMVTGVTTANSASQPSVPLFTSTTNFKSAPPVNPSTPISLPTAIAPSAATEAQTKDTTTPASALFSGTSAFTSSGNSIFGFTSAVTSNPSSSSAGTTSAVTSFGNSPFSGLASSTTNNSSSSGTSSLVSNTSSIFGNTSSATTSTGSAMFSSTPASTATGGSIFGFSAPAATSLSQSQSGNAFAGGSNSSSTVGSGVATSTQSTSSTSSPLFSAAGNTTFASGGSLFGSSSSSQSFGSGATFGFKSSSSETNAVSTSGATSASLFGSSWAAPKTTPVFSTASNSSSSSTGFAFGASSTSTAGNTSAPVVFGSSTSAPSNSIFPFSSTGATTQSQPVFGSSTPGFAFGSSAPTSNNDQMEDSMAEDTVQAAAAPTMPVFVQQPAAPATPTMPVFGQQSATPPSSGFIFGSTPTSGANPFQGSTPTSGANPFQFGGQPSIATTQTPNPFQASSSVEFNAGGSFSLGSSGVDKANRKYIRPKGSRQRKK